MIAINKVPVTYDRDEKNEYRNPYAKKIEKDIALLKAKNLKLENIIIKFLDRDKTRYPQEGGHIIEQMPEQKGILLTCSISGEHGPDTVSWFDPRQSNIGDGKLLPRRLYLRGSKVLKDKPTPNDPVNGLDLIWFLMFCHPACENGQGRDKNQKAIFRFEDKVEESRNYIEKINDDIECRYAIMNREKLPEPDLRLIAKSYQIRNASKEDISVLMVETEKYVMASPKKKKKFIEDIKNMSESKIGAMVYDAIECGLIKYDGTKKKAYCYYSSINKESGNEEREIIYDIRVNERDKWRVFLVDYFKNDSLAYSKLAEYLNEKK